MSRYAVIGQPVAHSRSPRIQKAFAKQCGIELDYETIEIAADVLDERLCVLHAHSYAGLNVTLPHKTAAAALCENVSDRARHAEAVNVLIRTGNGWRGDNTDGIGLVADLKHNLGVELGGRRVLLLGSGGVARGLLEPLLMEKPAELVLSNRSPQTPEALAKQFEPLGVIRPSAHFALKGDRFDVIINATSAGHSGSVPRLPPGLFTADTLAYDLNYGKASEPFLAWALDQGAARSSDGLGMLVEQAAESFQLWHGVRPQTPPVLESLRAVD